ncbi:TetR family transcriptional regulator [Mycolicibacter minnesotensis]
MQLHKRDPKDEIVAAATTILDDYGIADLSMRRLARELNISPSALYWHFANKQQLLGAVADRVLAPACTDPGPGPWQWRVRTVGERLRDALLSHTDGAELVSACLAAGQSQAATDIVALLAVSARQAGVHPDQAEQVGRTVVYYVLGFTADEQSRLQWDAAGAAEIRPDADPAGSFAFGLGLLIDGLAMRVGAPVT